MGKMLQTGYTGFPY